MKMMRMMIVAGMAAAVAAMWPLLAQASLQATGGEVSVVDIDAVSYRVHVFTNSSTFTVGAPGNAEYLVVAGGGGGGGNSGFSAPRASGGGGAGGLLINVGSPTTLAAGAYTITVGEGGAGNQNGTGTNGDDSSIVFDADPGIHWTAKGGGGGGGRDGGGATGPAQDGAVGGSGGGPGRQAAGGAAEPGQGHPGAASSGDNAGGGGGGANGQGANGQNTIGAGDGGPGLQSFIRNPDGEYFAGGGGGAGTTDTSRSTPNGGGGLGGGGAAGADGAPHTGGGGGGGGVTGTTYSGSGGSGIVIIRYPALTDLPLIMNVGLADLTDTTADLVGALVNNGVSEATVTLYWATTDYTTNATDWVANGFSAAVGPYADGAVFTNAIGDLVTNTWYYWNHSAQNASDTVWAATSGSPSFKTLGPPSVDNAGGATLVSASIASLHGTLLDGAPADVYIDLWADGSGETNRYDLGSTELGPFTVDASGLTPDTLYHYRGFVSNAYGTAWADTSTNFTTTGYTDGNVTWSGGAGTLHPEWFRGQNWVGGLPPAKTTGGTLTFSTADTSVLDDDYTVGSVAFVGSAANHVVNLDGKVLTVGGLSFSGSNTSGRPRGRFTGPSAGPGTLRVGSPETAANIALSVRNSTLLIGNGVTLGGNIGTISMSQDTVIDVRGSKMENGLLEFNTFNRGRDSYVHIDNTTDIDMLRVNTAFNNSGEGGLRHFGDPNDAQRRLPDNLLIVAGSDSAPAIFDHGAAWINRHIGFAASSFNSGSGGSFTGRLSRLRVGCNVTTVDGTSSSGVEATMDLAGMDACDIVTTTLLIGTVENESFTPPSRGKLVLPAGELQTGTLRVGRDKVRDASNWGDLILNGTHADVTNSAVIYQSGRVTVNLYGTSAGLDFDEVATLAISSGGNLHLEFVEPPDPGEDRYWGLRIAGNRKDNLLLLVGLGALTSNFDAGDPGFAGKQVGVLVDDDFTYFAMADEDAFPSDPIAGIRDRTFEVKSGGSVTLAPSDIDNGSFDPLDRDFTLTMNYGAQTGLAELELTGLDPHTVTLVITIDDEPSDTDQADAIVTLTDVIAGTEADLTWNAGASTALMDRREWFWGANWNLGQPPLNPSGVKLNFPLGGTSIAAPLSGTSMTVGALTFNDAAHTINVSNHTVTVGSISYQRAFTDPRVTFTGAGTIRIGQTANPANISINQSGARLTVASGTTLGGHIGHIDMNAYGSDTYIDLRGAIMENGLLEIDRITMRERDYIYLNQTTEIDTLRINQSLEITQRRGHWIGDPGDPAFRRLPTNLVVVVGNDMNTSILDLGVRTSDSYFEMGPVHFNASSGGSFTGRLSRLRVGHSTSSGSGPTISTMDLASMDACDVVAGSFSVGTSDYNYWSNPDNPGPVRATVALPAGDVLTGSLTVGRDAPRDAVNWADLVLNGTRFAVTNAATIHGSGMVTITIGATPGGLLLTEAATLDVNGKIHITFNADPEVKSEPHYGLRWEGDHVAALAALLSGDSIVIDDTALTTPASIYLYQGVTYLGSTVVPGGTLFLLR